MAQADLRAALGRITRRQQLEFRRTLTDLAHEQLEQCIRLALHRRHVDSGIGIQRRIERRHRQDRRGADPHCIDPLRRPVVRSKLERGRMSKPALQWLPQPAEMSGRHISESRRTRATIEELVAAADREVGIGRREIDRHGAGAMRQVPDDQRPCIVRAPGKLRHVEPSPGAIVDLGQQHHRDLVVDRRGRSISARRARSPLPIRLATPPAI